MPDIDAYLTRDGDDNNSDRPELALWRSVLLLTIEDYKFAFHRLSNVLSKLGWRLEDMEKHSAPLVSYYRQIKDIEYFVSHEWFEEMCDLAEIEVHSLRKIFTEHRSGFNLDTPLIKASIEVRRRLSFGGKNCIALKYLHQKFVKNYTDVMREIYLNEAPIDPEFHKAMKSQPWLIEALCGSSFKNDSP